MCLKKSNKLTTNNKKLITLCKEADEFVLLVESKEYENSDINSKLPLIVNSLFAIELYLKILLLKHGETIPHIKSMGHNLKKLFDSLPNNLKDNIYNWVLVFYQKDVFKYLNKIKNDFVDLRYMYFENKLKDRDIKLISEIMYKIQNVVHIELYGKDMYKEIHKKN